MTKYSATQSYKVSELVRALEYQHPLGVSTFGRCIKCKSHPARGGGVCPSCLEDELAELIGKPLAWEVRQAYADYMRLKHHAIYGDDREDTNQEATS